MAFNLKNTSQSYGLIAIFLHWLVAVAFIGNYALVYAKQWFYDPKSEMAKSLFSHHTTIGVSIFVFIVLRIIWRLMNKGPNELPGSKLSQTMAKLGHIALYVAMFIIPLTGYLGTGGSSKLFYLWELPSFRDTSIFAEFVQGFLGMSWQTFESVADIIHKQGSKYFVSVLIGIHIAAAFYHHYALKDAALKRITYFSRSSG